MLSPKADLHSCGYRYVSSKTQEASSLFFSSGTTFEEYAEGGHYRMTKADKRYVVSAYFLAVVGMN